MAHLLMALIQGVHEAFPRKIDIAVLWLLFGATRAAFSIPEDYELGAAAAIGYLGDLSGLTGKTLEQEMAPRVRKPLEEIAFEDSFGQAAVL